MIAAVGISILFGMLSSVSFLVVYGLGADWWSNRIGRSLMTQSLGFTATLIYVAVRRVLNWSVPLPHSAAVGSLVVFTAVGLLECQRSWAFYREIRDNGGPRHRLRTAVSLMRRVVGRLGRWRRSRTASRTD